MRLPFAIILLSTASCGWAQSRGEQRVRELLGEARSAKPQLWAKLLMEADGEAAKLELRTPPLCCGVRCVQIQNFLLQYRWSEIQSSENYGHDLLKVVIGAQGGTRWGADALVTLLRTANDTIGTDGVPLFKTVLDIVQARRWRALKDPRLTRIEAEAYETWWSLSLARPDDPDLQTEGLEAADFREGAELARRKAIAAYDALPAAEKDQRLRRRISDLRQRRDTEQRTWYLFGD